MDIHLKYGVGDTPWVISHRHYKNFKIEQIEVRRIEVRVNKRGASVLYCDGRHRAIYYEDELYPTKAMAEAALARAKEEMM